MPPFVPPPLRYSRFRLLDLLLVRYCPLSFAHRTLRPAFLLLPLNCNPVRRGSGTEEILWKPAMMPSVGLYLNPDRKEPGIHAATALILRATTQCICPVRR